MEALHRPKSYSPIFTFYHFPNSGLYLINDFDFDFQWRDTENNQWQKNKFFARFIEPLYSPTIKCGICYTKLNFTTISFATKRKLDWIIMSSRKQWGENNILFFSFFCNLWKHILVRKGSIDRKDNRQSIYNREL